jgi:hypothetical protein
MQFLRGLIAILLVQAAAHAAPPEHAVVTSLAQPGLTADQLGIIVNDDDPDSAAIAAYYRDKRGIPAANLIHVRFKPGRSTLSREEFINLKRRVDRKTPKQIQAYALTWAQPYRVDCMSITSAFAFGFDPAYCASSCKPTQPSPYFNSGVARPHAAYKIRHLFASTQNSSHSSLLPPPAAASFLGLAIALTGAPFGFGKAVVEPCRTGVADRTL